MFSRVAEWKMLSVRGMLLAAWLILIASLFWDPYTAALTASDNETSPFSITSHAVTVQGRQILVEPYELGARIFWTMAVPILPLFLMVFGHEAWRRICPLSLASQIPGMAGLRRFRSALDRRTGTIRKVLPLMDRQGWMARNSWYVQFGLLFAGIVARLLIINADRTAMGIALLVVIGAAMTTGLLWGGKTWCNYFCPANIVQKIYTEPSGILESTPHFSRPKLPQSMCRKPSRTGDVSACVGCLANCGDIDLQRSYWNGILEPQRRNVYYMFFGLIIGFYGYYFLYSGNWDYYFSGIWTHESSIRENLLGPGFYVFGQEVAIPKLVAAPMTLAIACGLSLALGRWLESFYRRWCSRRGVVTEKVVVHHCLSVSAWLSINSFYLFGGRPNILLITPLGGRLIDIAIVALTTVWLRRVLQQSPFRYQQESMASSLLAELKKMKVNVSKFLDGRNLDELKANELYLLNKALPGYSKQQKLNAYQKILAEAVTKGSTANSSAIKLLAEFREQMEISEEEHNALLEELGLSDFASSDIAAVSAEEKLASLHHYRGIVGSIVVSRLNEGAALQAFLKEDSFRLTIEVVRQSLQISEEEHRAILEEVTSETGAVGARMEEILELLMRLRAVRLCLETADVSDPIGTALMHLLFDALDSREQQHRLQALQILRNLAIGPNTLRYARELSDLSGYLIDFVLRQIVPGTTDLYWRDVLDPQIMAILAEGSQGMTAMHADDPTDSRTPRAIHTASLDVEANLAELLLFDDPVLSAIALMIFSYISPTVARDTAQGVLSERSLDDEPLLSATVLHLAGLAEEGERPQTGTVIKLTARVQGEVQATSTFRQDYVSIGRASDNDLVVSDPAAWTYHAAITVHQGDVRLVRLDGGKVFVDGYPMQGESVVLRKSSVITFDRDSSAAPEITVDWVGSNEETMVVPVQPILRLGMVAQNDRLSCLSLSNLADIALEARVLRYMRGVRLEETENGDGHFLIHQGEVRLFDPAIMDFIPDVAFGPGDLLGRDLFGHESQTLAEVVSDFAVVVELRTTPEVRAVAHRPGRKDMRLDVLIHSRRFAEARR